ncbi:hypothetical protein NQ315_016069 [Exocentrus adspersus]|uniref:RNA-directed DNA polymerase n=1 Tax=Exocentrus adspersus TaxID=1586481 RepID=A0AAV8VLU0_9CUCU|nr:hypothetical protein NQ315_016069 [Exocentrus adspersus]
MRPYFQDRVALNSPQNIQHLKQQCRTLEDVKVQTTNFKESTNSYVDIIGPELTFSRSNKSRVYTAKPKLEEILADTESTRDITSLRTSKPTVPISTTSSDNKDQRKDNKWAEWLAIVKNFYSTSQVAPLLVNKSDDHRPFIRVVINNTPVDALLDTGATQTVLGKKGLRMILDMDIDVEYHAVNCQATTADGVTQRVIGEVLLPVVLNVDFVNKSYKIAANHVSNNEFICSIRTENDLTAKQKQRLDSVVNKFKDISSTDRLGYTHLVEHRIEVTEPERFRQRSFPMSPYMRDNLNKEIDKMLELGIIKPSKSPYSSNRLTNKVTQNPELHPNLCLKDGRLYQLIKNRHNLDTNFKEWKLVVPRGSRLEVLKECHDDPSAAHFGCSKTYSRVIDTYYWPGLKHDVKKYVYKCEICNQQKVSQLGRIGLMGAPKDITEPFRLISLDIAGPFPKSMSNHSYILVAIDWFTKFTFIHPMRRATAKEICTYVEKNIFTTFGVPQILVMDNGSQFISKEFKGLLKKYNITNTWYNAKFHPQVNNVERSNRVIGTAIRSYRKDNQRHWDSLIPQISYAINTSVHEVTGYTPDLLTFGRQVPISGDYYGDINSKADTPFVFAGRETLMSELEKLPEIYRDVAKRISLSYQRNKKYYDLRKRNIEFEVGDTVYKRNYVLSNAGNYFSAKLAPKFIKCTITKKLSPIIYELRDETGKNIGRYHVKDLKQSLNDRD